MLVSRHFCFVMSCRDSRETTHKLQQWYRDDDREMTVLKQMIWGVIDRSALGMVWAEVGMCCRSRHKQPCSSHCPRSLDSKLKTCIWRFWHQNADLKWKELLVLLKLQRFTQHSSTENGNYVLTYICEFLLAVFSQFLPFVQARKSPQIYVLIRVQTRSPPYEFLQWWTALAQQSPKLIQQQHQARPHVAIQFDSADVWYYTATYDKIRKDRLYITHSYNILRATWITFDHLCLYNPFCLEP